LVNRLEEGELIGRAVWTRFHPLAYKLQELLFSGKLGKVKRFQADFSMQGDLDGGPFISAEVLATIADD
jgi:predicted dehydrogenase